MSGLVSSLGCGPVLESTSRTRWTTSASWVLWTEATLGASACGDMDRYLHENETGTSYAMSAMNRRTVPMMAAYYCFHASSNILHCARLKNAHKGDEDGHGANGGDDGCGGVLHGLTSKVVGAEGIDLSGHRVRPEMLQLPTS